MLHVSQLSLRSAYRQGLFSGHPAAKKLWLEDVRNEQITCLTNTPVSTLHVKDTCTYTFRSVCPKRSAFSLIFLILNNIYL